jgi:hypothetical protein
MVDLEAGYTISATAPDRWITSPVEVDLWLTGGSSRMALTSIRRRFIAEARHRPDIDLADYLEGWLVRRTPTWRFVRVWGEMSLPFLPEVLRFAGIEWNHGTLEKMPVVAMVDPKVCRDSLFDRFANA